MARKAVVSGGTRDEIVEVAKRLFFEKGFDGVSIREIQREVGCEVGLFYYYFKSKDLIFDVVMDEATKEWSSILDEAVQSSTDEAKFAILAVIEGMYQIFADLGEVLHWSVRGAICSRVSEIGSACIKEILSKSGTNLRMNEENLAGIIAGGAANLVFGCPEYKYRRVREEIGYLLDAVLPEYRGRNKELSVELL